MERRKNIKSRWKLINNLFIGLVIALVGVLIIREFQIFKSNIDYFNEDLYNFALHELQHEVDNRVDEIDSLKQDIEVEFYQSLEKLVKDVDFFAVNSVQSLGPLATLEEKRAKYIDTIYQYDVYEDKYIFFAMDLDGVSYLSGLAKNLEGTNISFLQDEVTGSYFVLDMIDIINNSEDKQGYITYYWMKEVGGEHIKKTSFIYYNEELELFIGTGLYEIDYIEQVQEELFNRIGSYYTDDGDYVYIISYDGDVIYHPDENFDTEALLAITIGGESFHQTILDDLSTNETTIREYYFDFENADQMKTGYIRRIDDWDMYIGKSIVFSDLEIEQQMYFDSLFIDFLIFNLLFFLFVLGFVVVIKTLINRNFIDIEMLFKKQNEEVKDAFYQDVLTGLYNRSYFDVALDIIYRDTKEISVFMLDANGLKLINDVYGHSIGDELLMALAQTLKSVFIDGTIFRWGGDEFIVLVSDSQIGPNEYIKMFNEKSLEVKIKEIELSASIGFAVDNYKKEEIYDLINLAEAMMYKNKTLESLTVKRKVIDDLLQTLYKSFEFEEEHSKSVMEYAIKLGEQLNQNKDQLDRLRLAALLHDVGKIGMSAEIVNKETKLSKDEMEKMRNHPEKGLRILSAYPELSEFGNYSLTHHENYDGSGYPRGIKGENIPLFSRIISIAEAYAVMISPKTYKDSVTKAEAIVELIKNKGTQFDPELVDVFIKALKTE